jgi:hypothetical protein
VSGPRICYIPAVNDPTDIEEGDGLTPEEEEGIRLALEEADRGEGVEIEQFRKQLRAEFRALQHVRRAG